jgi:methenyltetrahydrofolate cyclohydrolase
VSKEHGGETGVAAPGYLDLPIGQFLGALSATTPAPSGGGVAALAVAFAAGLCVMVAGLSARDLLARDQALDAEAGLGAEALAERARQLRDRAAPLAQADAEGYSAVLAALRAGGKPAIQAALSDACSVPMEVARIGAEVAGTAATLAARGKASVRGDAITAALLAAAGSRSAAALVRINLAGDTGLAGDARPGEARCLAAEATRLATEAESTAQ